jgi:drug/metabolite transporter (DMT)-like permease
LGIFVTSITFLLQNWGQSRVSSSTMSIYIALEPIFATFFGFLIGGEEITINLIIGGILIMAGTIYAIKLEKDLLNSPKILPI